MSNDALEMIAAAIWAAEYDEPLPPPGTVQRAMADQMATAAMRAKDAALIEAIREQRAADIKIRNSFEYDSPDWAWFDARIRAVDELLAKAGRQSARRAGPPTPPFPLTHAPCG